MIGSKIFCTRNHLPSVPEPSVDNEQSLKELSTAAWILLKQGGKMYENILKEKYQPPPIPKEGLGIVRPI